MPLKMTMEPQDWLMIGSTRVTNIHPTRAVIALDGAGPVLRSAHVIEADQVDTPSKRLYLALQRLYLQMTSDFTEYNLAMKQLPLECHIVRKAAAVIERRVAAGSIYGALREARGLI